VAEQNLLRVSDLKSEVGLQLSALEEQAQKASRYVDLKGRLREVEIGLCKKQLSRFLEQRAQLLAQIEELKKQAEQDLAGQRQLEEKKLEMRQAIRDVEQKERDLRAELSGELNAPLKMQILNASSELAEQKNALRDLEEKIRFANFEIDRNTRSAQNLAERGRTLDCEIPGVTTFVESTRTKLQEIKDRTAVLLSQKAGFEEEEERTLESILSLVKDIYTKLSGLSGVFAEKFLSGAEGAADKNVAILSLGENIGGMLQELKDGTEALDVLLRRKREFKQAAGAEAANEADLRVELATQEARLSNLKAEAERITAEVAVMSQGSELRREEIGLAEAEKNKLLADIDRREQEIDEMNGQLSFARSSINQKLEELAAQREKLENELDNMDRAGGAGGGLGVNEGIMKAEISLAKLEGENLAVVNKLMEEYGMTVEEALEKPFTVSSVAKAREEIDGLRLSLRELEPVNLLAIDEFRRVKERVAFIDEQYADLVAAKEGLRTLIAELDTRAQESFLQTIETVNRNFQEIFASLFEGGEAKIVLGEGVDALSSGIEIIARPRGRKWLNLSLLSGGEKSLTAIAILFSLLKTHPSPFCFLDEVDAALDDANVRRFTKMLREFALAIQMVVITHNKRTMEAADVIYGITMEEPGISKVISMKLSAVAVPEKSS
jgi:chromosome segregation protein